MDTYLSQTYGAKASVTNSASITSTMHVRHINNGYNKKYVIFVRDKDVVNKSHAMVCRNFIWKYGEGPMNVYSENIIFA